MLEENNMELNRLAFASFVLGTISVITQLLWIFFTLDFKYFHYVSYVSTPIAIIAGAIALNQISKRNGNQRNKRFARAGIILGVVNIGLCNILSVKRPDSSREYPTFNHRQSPDKPFRSPTPHWSPSESH
jgi:hypothetical protein